MSKLIKMTIIDKTKVLTYREQYIAAESAVFRGKFEEFDLNLLYKLPEDMSWFILQFLPANLFDQVRKYFIYLKYYKKCYLGLQNFTYREINQHFHKEDYFSMSANKNITITNYIKYNLQLPSSYSKFSNSTCSHGARSVYPSIYLSNITEIVDDEKFDKLKTIIICLNVRSGVIRMKQRRR